MKKLKVLSVVGTRPEAVKMAPVILELQKYPDRIDSRVCVTAQHRQMLDQTLAFFQIQPDIDLNLMRPGQSLSEITCRALESVTEVLREERPDIVLLQGDTTTVLATALAAFYQKIAVGHIEAGLRTADRYNPFPEEINRRVAGVIASYHFAPTQTAVDALLAEKVPAHTIFRTGNTVVDALLWTSSRPPTAETAHLLQQLGTHQRSSQTSERWILVTAHRRENFGEPFEKICLALRDIIESHPEVGLIYPVHMNPNVREPVYRILNDHKRIHLIEPLSYETFVHLLQTIDIVLTDSGGVQEEAPVFGKPVLVLRNETERPEAIAAGTARLVGPNRELIVEETRKLLNDQSAYTAMANAVSPYGDGNAAERIVQILLSL
ncbi:MAG TPA: UDP-N-acetylglucosamine 2-epimerase (non-hydrolyzing) [Chloroflexia bacterium]|nr:UDP-N-acetylglucosamine 2-epimerase (non-hydrolyzing) [Chloroflexia bacterium]